MRTKTMNHGRYQRQVREWDTGKLEFIIFDCKKALEANPDNPNADYYLDEINYCSQELARRKERNRRGYIDY